MSYIEDLPLLSAEEKDMEKTLSIYRKSLELYERGQLRFISLSPLLLRTATILTNRHARRKREKTNNIKESWTYFLPLCRRRRVLSECIKGKKIEGKK